MLVLYGLITYALNAKAYLPVILIEKEIAVKTVNVVSDKYSILEHWSPEMQEKLFGTIHALSSPPYAMQRFCAYPIHL